MARLQDDIGNGIAMILKQSQYAAVIGGAGYGYDWDKAGDHGALGRALVMPDSKAHIEPDLTFEDSGQFAFNYTIHFEVQKRETAVENVSAILDLLTKDLGDGGETLYCSVSVNNADLLGGSLVVEMGEAALGNLAGLFDESENADAPEFSVPVLVKAWQTN